MRMRGNQRRIAGLFALAGGSFALLIWLKLRLVTGVPRTAFADPEANDPKNHHTPHAVVHPAVRPAEQVEPAKPAPTEPKPAPEATNLPPASTPNP